jgi:hypothetical protein
MKKETLFRLIEEVIDESNIFDNIRKKKERCKGKPKTGDCAEDRPSKKNWDKATKNEELYEDELEEKKSAAWQRKAGKNKEGGLNAKGRKSYEKENPGSDLKAPVSKKTADKNPDGKAAGRRKSFCARMKGMKKKNTSKKTANDPDSRINKALRKWDC